MSQKGIGVARQDTIDSIYTNVTKDVVGDDVQDRIVDALDSLSQDLYDNAIPYETGEAKIFESGGVKSLYLCLAGTIPGESPSTTPSKWFRISNTISVGTAFSYDLLGYFDTQELGLSSSGNFLAGTMGPTSYYFEGTYKRLYFVFLEGRKDTSGAVRSGKENKSWLSYYDLNTKVFANPVTFTEYFPDSNDLHNLPTVIVADNGNIVVIKESLLPSGGHNSKMEIWVSDNTEDISAFTKVVELNYELSYPQIYKLTNGNLYLICRERISGEERYNAIFRSVDDGLNWTSLSGVADTKTQLFNYNTVGYFGYSRLMTSKRSQGINLIVNPDIGVTGNTESVLFLHSDDGIIWENAREFVEGSGGFSHDIVASGAMTRTILDTNFLVDGPIASPTTFGLISRHGCLDENNIPYIVSEYYNSTITRTNRSSNIYLYYYDVSTHAWIKKDVYPKLVRSNTEFGYANANLSGTKIITYDNGKFDIIVNCVKDIGDLNNPDTVISSGTLVAGVHYRIITTDGSLKTNLVADDVFRSNGTETPDGSNTVVIVKTAYFIFRSEDYGETFSYIDLESINSGIGGYGATTMNQDCLDSKILFLGGQTAESRDKVLIEYSNLIFYRGKID